MGEIIQSWSQTVVWDNLIDVASLVAGPIGELNRVVHGLITAILLAWKLADDIYFFKFSLLVSLKKFVISPENRKKKQIKQKNQRKQFNMTLARMRVTIVEWTNKSNGRAYSKYLGCEEVLN